MAGRTGRGSRSPAGRRPDPTTSGATIRRTRKAAVSAPTSTLKSTASTSFAPARVRTMNIVNTADPIASRTGASHGKSRRWCSRPSPLTRASTNGQSMIAPKMIAGATIPGQEWARDRDAQDRRLPVRPESQRALEPAHIPVGLGRRGRGRRHVRSVDPDRIDLHETAEEGQHGGRQEQEPDGAERLARPQVAPDDHLLRGLSASELGVLLQPQDPEVDRDGPDHQERQQHDVEDVQAADQLGRRELAAEHEVRQPRARRTGSTATTE